MLMTFNNLLAKFKETCTEHDWVNRIRAWSNGMMVNNRDKGNFYNHLYNHISTKVGTNHSWIKEIQFSSEKATPFKRKYLTAFIFSPSRIAKPILTKLVSCCKLFYLVKPTGSISIKLDTKYSWVKWSHVHLFCKGEQWLKSEKILTIATFKNLFLRNHVGIFQLDLALKVKNNQNLINLSSIE